MFLRELTQPLSEINMAPSNLAAATQGIAANVGMEFETIVPLGPFSKGLPPDFTYDTPTFNELETIIDFFDSGPVRTPRRTLGWILDRDYTYWRDGKVSADWDAVKEDAIEEYISSSDDYEDYGSKEVLRLIDRTLDDPDSHLYQTVKEHWIAENVFLTEEDWLQEIGLESMRDVYEKYADEEVKWPYVNTDASIERIAAYFGKSVNMPYNWSPVYHGAIREPGKYAIEPDTSIEPADKVSEIGVEFVSPPLPMDQILQQLNAVKGWATKVRAYTNESTGLHINVSLPGLDWNNLDYVKLALLSGDDYVAKSLGRYGNDYCKSVMRILQNTVETQPESAIKLLDQMKSHMNTMASKVIHSGKTEHRHGINVKPGYIEFRSVGGDWLNENFGAIKQSLDRYIVALNAAL